MPLDKGFCHERVATAAEVGPFYPDNESEALDYILHHGFVPEVDVYQGHPDVQRGIAQALGLYHPGKDLTQAIDAHIGYATQEDAASADELALRRSEVAKNVGIKTVYVVNQQPVADQSH